MELAGDAFNNCVENYRRKTKEKNEKNALKNARKQGGQQVSVARCVLVCVPSFASSSYIRQWNSPVKFASGIR